MEDDACKAINSSSLPSQTLTQMNKGVKQVVSVKSQTLITVILTGVLLLWAGYTVFVTVRLFMMLRPLATLVTQIHPGMTMQEVRFAVGEPDSVYASSQLVEAYSGWHPKPLISARGPIWVYNVSWTYLVVVYWDEKGRVMCIDVART